MRSLHLVSPKTQAIRPNSPYVFFKYDGTAWQRISISEFPAQFKDANVVVGGRSNPTQQNGATLSPENVGEQNRNVPSYLRVIAREPIVSGEENLATTCEKLVYYKGAWVSPGDSIGRKMMDRMSK